MLVFSLGGRGSDDITDGEWQVVYVLICVVMEPLRCSASSLSFSFSRSLCGVFYSV